ncbi:MAG: aldo/keto reductase [Gammaproteobacteria bacterium]|nr:aldo/keto reductase [Gammaproteobacteria bacterium]
MNDCARSKIAVDTARRHTLKVLGLGAAALATPGWVRGAPATRADLAMKPIPRTGELVPAIGLGTHMAFDVKPGKPREHLREVMKIFYDGGGRLIDTSPLYGLAEVSIGDYATALGITRDLFMADKVWVTGEWLGDDSHAKQQFRRSMERLWRDQIDLMQCHSLVNAPTVVRAMQDWKNDGQIRYLGVTHHQPSYFDLVAPWVEKGTLDFVQVRYSLATRAAEERILPAALETGTAVIANMPFEKARLFQIVKGRPLPDFAAEIGCETWAQFFLKWIISHPALTCAIPATTNPKHQADNIGALKGPLPDVEMRRRMLAHMETIPEFDKVAKMPVYPEKTFDGVVNRGPRAPSQKK